MANTKSAKKATRVAVRRTAINKNRLSRIRTYVRKVEEAIASGNQTAAKEHKRPWLPLAKVVPVFLLVPESQTEEYSSR